MSNHEMMRRQTHLRRSLAVPCRDPTSFQPFRQVVVRLEIQHPGLWLSPLFNRVFG